MVSPMQFLSIRIIMLIKSIKKMEKLIKCTQLRGVGLDSPSRRSQTHFGFKLQSPPSKPLFIIHSSFFSFVQIGIWNFLCFISGILNLLSALCAHYDALCKQIFCQKLIAHFYLLALDLIESHHIPSVRYKLLEQEETRFCLENL